MSRCPRCELQHQCLCEHIPTLLCEVRLLLLTHPNEQTRETNTGKLLQWCGLPVVRHLWDRKSPAPALLTLLQDPTLAPVILFPSDEALTLAQYQTQYQVPLTPPMTQRPQKQEAASGLKQPLFIILDATWQEARKMRNKSQWLSHIPELKLTERHAPSRYSLRRNQQSGHVCTCEVGEWLLEELGYHDEAKALADFFQRYLVTFQADKSGHALR